MSHLTNSSRSTPLEPSEASSKTSYKKPGAVNLKCRYPQLQLVISEKTLDEILNQKFTILAVFPDAQNQKPKEIAYASFTFESGITTANSYSLEDVDNFPKIYNEIRNELSDSLHQRQARPLPIHFSPGFPTMERDQLKDLADAAGVVTDLSKITSHPLAYLLGVRHLAIALKVSQHFPFIDVEAADRIVTNNSYKLKSALDYVRTSSNALIQSARAALRKASLVSKGTPYMTTLYLSGFDRLDNEIGAHAVKAISNHFGVICVAPNDSGDFVSCEAPSFDDLKKILKTQNSVDFEYYLNPQEPWTLRFLTIYATEPHSKDFESTNSSYLTYNNSREPSPSLRMNSLMDMPLYTNFGPISSLEKVADPFYSDREPIRYGIDDSINNEHIFPMYSSDLEPLIPLETPSKLEIDEADALSDHESSVLKDTETVATPSNSPTPPTLETPNKLDTTELLLFDPNFNYVLRCVVGAMFICVLIDFIFLTSNIIFAFFAVILSGAVGEYAANKVSLQKSGQILLQTLTLILIGALCVKTFLIHK